VTGPDDADDTPLGGDIDRLEIELRVTDDDLDPDRITRMLGVHPTLAGRKGEAIDRHGVPVLQRTGVWSYALPASPEWELGDAIDTLLEGLPHDPALWESLAGWATVTVVCGLCIHDVDRAADLEPDTLARLAERRLALRLEIRGVIQG
jgi:Domain of unknown function (DUF4279)